MNYMDGTKPLVEKESQFQYYQDDLVALSSGDDHGTLEDIVHFILSKVFPRRLTLFVCKDLSSSLKAGLI